MTRAIVRLTRSAEADLLDILTWTAETMSSSQVRGLLDALLAKIEGLAVFPQKGVVVPELTGVDEHEYRQIVHYPYRIVYSFDAPHVEVEAILDGRRDVEAIFRERMARNLEI